MYDHADLVMRAVRNAGLCSTSRAYRWVHVQNVFAVDSTVAAKLCRKFGIDPNEIVGGRFECQEREKTLPEE